MVKRKEIEKLEKNYETNFKRILRENDCKVVKSIEGKAGGEKGSPDVIGCFYGIPVSFEMKKKKHKVYAEQEEYLRKNKLAFVVTGSGNGECLHDYKIETVSDTGERDVTFIAKIRYVCYKLYLCFEGEAKEEM